MERTDSFYFDGEEYEFSYDISPKGEDDWDVEIIWVSCYMEFSKHKDVIIEEAIEVAKLWADENFDKEEYYEERRWIGNEGS